ncbi:MAG TPA: glycosyltransferase family 2 protein [Chitinophagaceae bacterium]|nr:glycosyltransferase family 2 protein [Chitinophagaceae bacterium]
MMKPEPLQDLVTVIIPCYNHSHYLGEAVESVLKQSHSNYEIIVVDDGSTDDSKAVAEKYPSVQYIYQSNQGLSAARNTGVTNSKGTFLVFLDADDWLYPEALEINLGYLLPDEKVAFVSGAFKVYDQFKGMEGFPKKNVDGLHYQELLKMNYIGMHATVMYRRWVFDHFCYDTSLKACEDYDLYLKIARSYPVLHHTKLIAAYRKHTTNMSSNVMMMIDATFTVLDRQKAILQNESELKSLEKGEQNWKRYYGIQLYLMLKNQPLYEKSNKTMLSLLWAYNPKWYFRLFAYKIVAGVKNFVGS